MKKAGKYIAILSRQLNIYFTHELSETELNASELVYLAQLYAHDGLTQEEMAKELSVDKAATARVMQSMEKKNLIVRKTDEKDKRAKRVFLTEKATRFEDRIREIQKDWITYITQDMTMEESEKFYSQLIRMSERAKELNGK